jgi:dUTP pyrophosphatase
MDCVTIPIQRLAHAGDLPLPVYATAASVGADLHAAIEGDLTIGPGERAAVPTGLCIAVPDGYEAQVRARSGLAMRHGVALVNAPGTIDADYRGEIRVLLVNLGQEPVTLRRGDRIAQIVLAPVVRAEWVEQNELAPTERGSGGFGHTGR